MKPLWREGAGGVIGEGAGWTICLVEVNEYFVLFDCICVVITTGWVGGVTIGLVHELDEGRNPSVVDARKAVGTSDQVASACPRKPHTSRLTQSVFPGNEMFQSGCERRRVSRKSLAFETMTVLIMFAPLQIQGQ